MILVDTSVWVDHLRRGDGHLATLLNEERVIVHPFVVGEIALGSLRHRDRVLQLLRSLPQAVIASHDEVLRMVSRLGLHGRGIGYVDAHLLAAVRLTGTSSLWSRDRRLDAMATDMGAAFDERAV